MYIRPRPRHRVKTYWKHPDATGYAEDLYAIPGADDETANHLEGRFLNRADNDAADALDLLENERGLAWMSASEAVVAVHDEASARQP